MDEREDEAKFSKREREIEDPEIVEIAGHMLSKRNCIRDVEAEQENGKREIVWL